MKKLLAILPFALMACSTVTPKQSDAPTPASPATTKTSTPPANELSDLNAMTFACPKAALNAAAREAKKAPTLGSYQFSFFRIASNSHHAQYEIHFKSNVFEEPELKYCVSIYCQQGWDPKTSKTTVRLMSGKDQSSGTAKTSAHEAMCGSEPAPRARQPKKHKSKR